MESLRTNVNQVLSDFNGLKEAIVASGVSVEDGTKTGDYAGKISEVFEAGKNAQVDEFWDSFQLKGEKTDYSYAFRTESWNDDTFTPKYDIRPTSAANMFYYSKVSNLRDIDVVLDFSKATSLSYCFQNAQVRYMGVVDVTGCSALTGTFNNTYWLYSIEKLIVNEDITFNDNCFTNSALKYLTVEGVVGQNISFRTLSGLAYESIMSVINALKDYSGTTTTRTLTLHADTKAKLSDSDIALATQKGWTLA